ncbi:glycosyltransferase family 1 protein [Amphritea opalescens]|uniref:Glycosyltransferase family 1 protein n=1 Tax=Amphritea opalescens TaxID=2490544 RepID=A0A430KNZ6_9GAMM|nr:glycosyltransferase [Amphritea opalescens]RTE65229.1 glycosyltransferase family 1 protein [Amphritea opalescens]
MKILHATEVDTGGTITVLKTLVESQMKSPSVNSVICLVPKIKSKTLVDIPKENIRTYRCSGRNLISFFLFSISLAVLTIKEKPDIIHLHSSFAGMFGRLVLFFLVPIVRPVVIYCPHGFSFLMDGSTTKRKVLSTIELLLSKITDRIICVSEYEKKIAALVGIKKSKLVVVHNGVSPIKGNVIKSKCSSSFGDKLNLLFVGRLNPAKGFDTLLAAMERLNDEQVHLTVLGISFSEVPSETMASNISYIGWCSEEEMYPYFMRADVLVLPSRWEGFPMVVLEAMNFSIPVVASNCTSLSESVKSGITGFLFPTSDYKELAKILSCTPFEKWKELGENGRKYYLENFTSEKMVQTTYKNYKELLGKKIVEKYLIYFEIFVIF